MTKIQKFLFWMGVPPAIILFWSLLGTVFYKAEAIIRIADMCSIEKENNCFDRWDAVVLKVDYLWESHEKGN